MKYLNYLYETAQALDSYLSSAPPASIGSNPSWKMHCISDIHSLGKELSYPSLWKATVSCLDLKGTTSGLYEVIKSSFIQGVKHAIQENINHLPVPFSAKAQVCLPVDYTALAIIASLSTFLYTATKTDAIAMKKRRDSMFLGTAVGTTISLACDQNLYLGAISGALAGASLNLIEAHLLPKIPSSLSDAAAFMQKMLRPLTHQRWDYIVSGVSGLVAGGTALNYTPEIGKEGAMFFASLGAATGYFAFNSYIFPVIHKTAELTQFFYETGPSMLFLTWVSSAVSQAIQYGLDK